uniref:Uncharacterized protein n=1 Tax=Anopheles atroparvus TaxID=41427 RepID=A0A182IKB6_ANOAO
MVLEHQGMLQNLQTLGSQPALQLYAAAAAAQLAPRNRSNVPPQWAPFLQFGVPNVFGGHFLTRPRFGPPGGPPNLSGLGGGAGTGVGVGVGAGAGSLPGGLVNGGSHPNISPHRTMQGPPSEDSNDDRENSRSPLMLANVGKVREQSCGREKRSMGIPENRRQPAGWKWRCDT